MSDPRLVCQYCKKEMKSKSGKTLHEKKCVVTMSEKHEESQPETMEAVPEPDQAPEPQSQPEAKEEAAESPVVLPGPIGEELPEGTVILITGQVWYQSPGNDKWEAANAQDIEARVQCVMANEQGKFVIAKSVGGNAIWAVGMGSNLYKVITYPTTEKVAQLSDGTKYNMKTGEVVRSASVQEQDEFKTALQELQHAKRKFLDAQKELKKIEKKYKFKIEEFTKKHGTESRDGKLDYAIFCGNTLVHVVRTPGKIITTLNKDVVLEWAMENGFHNILKTTIDEDKYEDAKKLNMIPLDKISEFEEQKEVEDRFALTIKEATANCLNCNHEFSGETGMIYDSEVPMTCPNCGYSDSFSKSLFK